MTVPVLVGVALVGLIETIVGARAAWLYRVRDKTAVAAALLVAIMGAMTMSLVAASLVVAHIAKGLTL